jgi:hypothetical protein
VELVAVEEQEPAARRQDRGTGAPGAGSEVRVLTDSPLSGAKAAM